MPKIGRNITKNKSAYHHSPNKHQDMVQVKIKRVARNKKAVTTKEKLVAGFGVGATLLGGGMAGGAKNTQPPPIVRTLNKQSSHSSLLTKFWENTFGVHQVKAASLSDFAGMDFTAANGETFQAGADNTFTKVGQSGSASQGTFVLDPSGAGFVSNADPSVTLFSTIASSQSQAPVGIPLGADSAPDQTPMPFASNPLASQSVTSSGQNSIDPATLPTIINNETVKWGRTTDGAILGFGSNGGQYSADPITGAVTTTSFPASNKPIDISALPSTINGENVTWERHIDGSITGTGSNGGLYGADPSTGAVTTYRFPASQKAIDLSGMPASINGETVTWARNGDGSITGTGSNGGIYSADPVTGAVTTVRFPSKTSGATITLNGGDMAINVGDAFVDPGAVTNDGSGQAVGYTQTGSVNTSEPGSYKLTYTIQGGSAFVTRTVTVVANNINASTLPGNINNETVTWVRNSNGSFTGTGSNGGIYSADASTGAVTTVRFPASQKSIDLSSLPSNINNETVTWVRNGDGSITGTGNNGGQYSADPNTGAITTVRFPASQNAIDVSKLPTSINGETVSWMRQPDGSILGNGSKGCLYTADPVTGAITTVRFPAAATISLVGGNMTLNVGDDFVDPGATTNDGSGQGAGYTETGTVNTSQAGTYTLTYTVEGGSASVSRTVTVKNTVTISSTATTAWKINDGSQVTVYEGSDGLWYSSPSGNNGSYSQDELTFEQPAETKTIREVALGSSTVNAGGEVDVSIVQGQEYSPPSSATVSYEDGTTATAQMSGSWSDSNTSNPGTYNIAYTLNGSTVATLQITVQASPAKTVTAISINGYDNGAQVQVNLGDNFNLPGGTVTYSDGSTSAAIVTGSVNTSKAGTYHINYSSGGDNATSTTLNVEVVDSKSVQSIEAPFGGMTTVNQGDSFTIPKANVTFDDGTSGTIAGEGTVDTNTPGTYTINYSLGGQSANLEVIVKAAVQKTVETININGYSNGGTIHIAQGSSFTVPQATVVYSDGSTSTISGSGSVDTSQPTTGYGSQITFSAGNQTTYLNVIVDPGSSSDTESVQDAETALAAAQEAAQNAQQAFQEASDSFGGDDPSEGIQSALGDAQAALSAAQQAVQGISEDLTAVTSADAKAQIQNILGQANTAVNNINNAISQINGLQTGGGGAGAGAGGGGGGGGVTTNPNDPTDPTGPKDGGDGKGGD